MAKKNTITKKTTATSKKNTAKSKKTISKPRFNPNLPKPLTTITAKNIIKAFKEWIEAHSNVEVDYNRWYCGITNNPPKRQSAHKSVNKSDTFAWVEMNAKSRRVAEAIETYFHNLGVKDSDSKGGSSVDSKYVYIYKKRPTWFD